MNLLTETIAVLKVVGKGPADVRWVGSAELWFSWAMFADVAVNAEYDHRARTQEVAYDLVVAGDGWWLERTTYPDRSEGWVYQASPLKPDTFYPPVALTVHQANARFARPATLPLPGWKSLVDLNDGDPSGEEAE